jgi:hypothetical protein
VVVELIKLGKIDCRSRTDVTVETVTNSDLAKSYPDQIEEMSTPPLVVPTGNGEVEKAFRQAGYRF